MVIIAVDALKDGIFAVVRVVSYVVRDFEAILELCV